MGQKPLGSQQCENAHHRGATGIPKMPTHGLGPRYKKSWGLEGCSKAGEKARAVRADVVGATSDPRVPDLARPTTKGHLNCLELVRSAPCRWGMMRRRGGGCLVSSRSRSREQRASAPPSESPARRPPPAKESSTKCTSLTQRSIVGFMQRCIPHFGFFLFAASSLLS